MTLDAHVLLGADIIISVHYIFFCYFFSATKMMTRTTRSTRQRNDLVLHLELRAKSVFVLEEKKCEKIKSVVQQTIEKDLLKSLEPGRRQRQGLNK